MGPLDQVLVIIATLAGAVATLPQIRESFRNPASLATLSPFMTALMALASSCWMVIDWHLGYPAFVLAGATGLSLVLFLISRQVWYHLRKGP